MKLKEYIIKLRYLLTNDRLFEVATELETYFKSLKYGDFGLKEAKSALDEIAHLESGQITPLTKDLKKSEIKERLKVIINDVERNLSPDEKVEENNTKPTPEDKEKFKALIEISEAGVKSELKVEGGKGSNKSTQNWLLKIFVLLLIGGMLYGFYRWDTISGLDIAPYDCMVLNKELKVKQDELNNISNLLDKNPTDIKLKADKMTHEDDITAIKSKISTLKCD